jgi:hypothetical protein
MTELLIRALALYVPLAALSLVAVIRRPTPRERAAAILACIWNLPMLLIVHQLAKTQGWWTIHVTSVNGGAQLLGMPVEVLLGWTLLWGAFPVIAFRRVPLPIVIAAASTMAIIYGFGFASWVEAQELRDRFGEDWRRYRQEVHNWRPRWRPYIQPDSEATLYVAATCGKCSEVGAWLERHHPHGLRITPAEHHPTRDLWRITYASADGRYEAEGIAALARAVEHINLAWALAAFFVRLPVIRPCVQLFVDASGGGPQLIKRTCMLGERSS